MVRALATAALIALAAPAAAAPFGGAALPAPESDEPIRTSFYLPMRDGVRLAVDLYRPARGGKPIDGRFPVIWHHTINRALRSPDGANRVAGGDLGLASVPVLARYGYVVAQVERRGNGASLGERRGYHDRNEANDAYAVNEWLAAQPWATGKVGIYGCSNTGEAVLHALTMAPPHLKAAFAGCFSWNKYDAMQRGGILAQWGTGPQRTMEQDLADARPVDADADRTLLTQAAREHLRSTPLLPLWRSMPFRDSFAPLVASRFWGEGSASAYQETLRRDPIPLYVLGGWRDDFRKEGMVAFANWAADRRHLLIGDWKHCRNDGFNLLAEMKRFFDAELKGIGAMEGDAVHYAVVHAPADRTWRAAPAWPPAGYAPATYALSAAGTLAVRTAPGGRVPVTWAATPACRDPFAKDPKVNYSAWLPCPAPEGAARFVLPPAVRDTEIVGSPLARLTVAADADDADVFVYLEDVAPDGTAEAMTDGRLRLSLRATGTAPYDTMGLPWRPMNTADAAPLVPGRPVTVTIDLLPVAWNLRAGHRLRLTATASDYRERVPEDGGRGYAILTGTGTSSLTLPAAPAR